MRLFVVVLPFAVSLFGCGAGANSPVDGTASGLSGNGAPGVSPPAHVAQVAKKWQTSFQADSTNARMGGTELRFIVPFDGKLFAGNGYWMDSAPIGPDFPGAQVLVLDGPGAKWRVDVELEGTMGPQSKTPGARQYQAIGTLNPITITSDGNGAPVDPPVRMLLAGPWSNRAGVDVFSRGVGDSGWTKATIASYGGNIRSFVAHVDTKTGMQMVFAGAASSADRPNGAPSASMYGSTFDAAAGALAWSPDAEPWFTNAKRDDTPPAGWRVMGFAEANGHLFATVGASIYERVDGAHPSWKKVYTADFPPSVDIHANGGLRGMRGVGPDGNQTLLVAVGGPAARLVRVDVLHGFKETVEADVVKLLSDAWGIQVGGSLFAYNDMLSVTDPKTGDEALVMGLEAYVPKKVAGDQTIPMWNQFIAQAHYIVRHADGTCQVFGIGDPATAHVSVRTMALSPFDGKTIYAGGFDANNIATHDSAWIAAGPLAGVLY